MSWARGATITRPDEFQRCYRHGRVLKNELAVIHVYRRGDSEPARVGFSVSRKVGKAVERNRVKRWMREAVYPWVEELPSGVDVVFSARTRAKTSGFWALQKALRHLLKRAELLGTS